MATRLVNISSTTSGSAPAAWGTVPDLTVSSITVESTSSVLLLVATVALGEATDATADFRFLVNGVATGSPNVHAFSDNAANGEAGGATLMWAIDGLSGSSNTFAVQWQDRTGSPIIEVSDPHTFQVIEFAAGASIIVDQSGNSLGTSPSSIGSLLSQSAVTTTAGAIHLFIGNIPIDPNSTDSTQRMQFGIDGTPEGPSSFFMSDTTLEGSGGELCYLKTGLSAASHSFELNWVIASGSGQPQSTSSVFGNANFQVIEITAPNTVHTNISSAASWATTTTYANDPNLASTETIGDSTAVVLVGATAAQAATGTDSCIDFSIGIDSANVGGIGRCYDDSTAMYEGTCLIHAATGLSGSHTFQLRAKELITGNINTSVDRQLWVVELPNEGITSVTPSNFDMDTASVTAAGQGFAATIGSSDAYLSPNDLLSEAGEVDITPAVNTWADGSINFDLTQLSAATLALLHTMGPGDRYLIINVGGVPGTNEFSYPIFLNRPVAMELRASANIAAGGEATTDQGTPPATKTGADFFTGRRWDDENGTDSLTFGADEYTWVEWCYGATAKAREVKYKYRVTVAGELLDTYTVVAKATITAGDGISVVQAVETNVAQALTLVIAFTLGIGQATEADTAQSITTVQEAFIEIVQAVENDIAQVITPLQTIGVSVNQANETDTAQSITPALTKSIPLSQVIETDVTQSFTLSQATAISLNQVIETDFTQNIVSSQIAIFSVNQVVEIDQAQSITVQQQLPSSINQVIEFDQVQSIDPSTTLIIEIGQIIESNIAQSFTLSQATIISVNQVIETDFTWNLSYSGTINQINETDLTQSIISSQVAIIPVNQIIETNTVQALTSLQATIISINQVFETNTTQNINIIGDQTIALNQISELDLAQLINAYKVPLIEYELKEFSLNVLTISTFTVNVSTIKNFEVEI